MSINVKLERMQETETEKGISGSASFGGEVGGHIEIVLAMRGEKSAVDSYLASLGVSSLGDEISLAIEKNAQSKL